MRTLTIAVTLAAILLATPTLARNANYSSECDNCSNQSSYSASNGDLFDWYFGPGAQKRRDDAKHALGAPDRYEAARKNAMGRAMTNVGWRGVSPGGFSSPGFSCNSRGC